MKLIELKINKILFLDNYVFTHNENSIDYLNNQAAKEEDLQKKIDFLNKAALIIEKFHSFFHFEQSYFHLQLAKKYLQQDLSLLKEEELNAAIFQDHLNFEAISLKNNQIITQAYHRVFKTFHDYLEFASNELLTKANKIKIQPQSYWKYNEDTVEAYKQIIKIIKEHHQEYHQQAAKLYLNRSLVFHHLGETKLSNNDILKAQNLDNDVKSKFYFNEIINQMGKIVVLGLGSNLGDRLFFLNNAIKIMQERNIIRFVIRSEIEETDAQLLPSSPAEWNLPYLNTVIKGVTNLEPLELMREISLVEAEMGRENFSRWAPRNIDIDILAYENKIFDSNILIIPHPRIRERYWVLKHFAEVYPEWKHPVFNKSITDLLKDNKEINERK